MTGVAGSIDGHVCCSYTENLVDVHLEQTLQIQPETPAPLFSRALRAHYRLSWAERLARNARGRSAPGVAITLFGVPGGFAAFLGLSTV
jgi:hypothetical protein